ncbi:MAG: response regulator transcription factor [Clostridium sp.]
MGKILLVEDDKQLALGVEYALRSEGYTVLKGETIEESKNRFDDNGDIDLILLDLTLPDGSGYDFCKYVRERNQTPIIFLTAVDEEVNVVLAFDLGADDYITKPIRIRELTSRIKAVLRRMGKNDEGSKLVSGDIILDKDKAKLFKRGEEILLTGVEYKLLIIFMSNPQKVMSREQIIHKLWDIDGEFVDNNTLSVYIRRIREKIEDDSKEPKYIKTLRGIGYKWN